MKIRHLNTEEQNAGLEQIRQAPTDDGSLELSGSRERWPLAGDQLYIDMDIGEDNMPTGTRLQLGTAIIEVTPLPHNGCRKFTERFGIDAMKWVNSDIGKQLHLRGINAKVVRAGSVHVGDAVTRI